jgi:hypothetical protein
MAAYVGDRLDGEVRAELEERMAGDPALRQEVEDLRALRVQMLRSRSVPVWCRPFALAGLAAAAALAAVAFWLGTAGERRPVENGGRPSVAAASIAALKDGDLRVALSGDGAVSGLPALDPELHDAIAGALRGTLPAPQGLGSLRSGPLTLLGGPEGAAAFAPETPLGTRVASDRPAFRWSAHPDARSYEVSVFDLDLQKRAGSGPITATGWPPTIPARRRSRASSRRCASFGFANVVTRSAVATPRK